MKNCNFHKLHLNFQIMLGINNLLSVGSLDEVVLNNVCRYLTESSRAMRMDLLDALAESRSIRFIDRVFIV